MRKYFVFAAFIVMLNTGCGKVSNSPVSPLVNPSTVLNNFDTGLNGWTWAYAKYNGVGFASISAMPATLATADTVSFGTEHTFGASAGAAKIDVSLGAVGDSFDTGYMFSTDTNVGFSAKVVSGWVYWDSGLTNSSGKVIAKFYGKFTTSYTYLSGSDTTLVQGKWVQVTWAPVSDTIDLTKCREWGMEIYGATGPFSPGVVYLDNLTY